MPTLTPAIVTDDAALTMAIDAFVKNDVEAARRMIRVLSAQRRLRAHLDDEQWHQVLDLDNVTTDRFSDLLHAVVRWAFSEGVRAGRRR